MNSQPTLPGLPPGPRIPRLLQMPLIMYRPLSYLRYCARKHGPIFYARSFAHPPMVVVADPEGVEAVFQASSEQLRAYPGNAIFLRLLGEGSFVFKDGDVHRVERKVAMPFLTRGTTSDLVPTLMQIAGEALEKWPEGEGLELFARLRALTYRTTLRRIVGFRRCEDEDALCQLIESSRGVMDGPFTLFMFNLGASVYPGPVRWLSRRWPKAKSAAKLQQRVREFTGEELDRKLAAAPAAPGAGDPGSYLDAVVAQLREEPDRWTRDEILDNLNLLIITGHESAAVTTSWLLWELLQRPDILEKVQDEVDRRSAPTARGDQGEGTPVLDAAIMETLRLHPPVPVATRSVVEPFRVGGYLLPQGTTVLACMYLTHASAQLWETPQAFKPERFLEGKPAAKVYFPFGGGRHRCPGADMGFQQVKCIATSILRKFELTYAGRRPPRAKYVIAAVLPDNGVPVTIRRRDAQAQASCASGGLAQDDEGAGAASAGGCPVSQALATTSDRCPGRVPD